MYKKKYDRLSPVLCYLVLENIIFPPMVGFINGNEWSLATLGFI